MFMFGPELRRHRETAGLTVTELAERVGYSKGYVSKVERGRARPSVGFIRACEAELGTDGALAVMVEQVAADNLRSSYGRVLSTPLRELGLGELLPAPPHSADSEAAADLLRVIFDQCRRLGDLISPHVVLNLMVSHARTVSELAAAATVPARARELWLLAARVAEQTGLMAQESGDDDAAVSWTNRAVDYAERGGDSEMAGFALVRQAEIALYRENTELIIRMARLAQADGRASARVRCLAAQREAQGHGLAGAYGEYVRALDQARRHAEQEDTGEFDLAWGITCLRNPIAATKGWALHDLGRSALAARILDEEVPHIGPGSVRTRTRYRVRHALAHATAGDVDHACHLTVGLLPDVQRIDSATVRVDLRRLSSSLRRWSTRPPVRELQADLTRALVSPERVP